MSTKERTADRDAIARRESGKRPRDAEDDQTDAYQNRKAALHGAASSRK